MAIKIQNLELISKQTERAPYAYKDLHLDFKTKSVFSYTTNKFSKANDIAEDYDESAIRNSLKNLFNTKPGQRFLFPTYGLDLNQFLFEGVSEFNGQLIGEKIADAIKAYEPRVSTQQINVVANPDENEYQISIILLIPKFNTTASINTMLDAKTQNFIFVETSRNR